MLTAIVSSAAREDALVSELLFDSEVWNFGRIKEADGPVSHVFKFTNSSREAVVIEHVAVSCGCTTPEFSRRPILPGASGEIKITYDPADRPGAFTKEVFVTSGAGKNRNKLVVKGEVEGRPRSIEEDYPYELVGGLRLRMLSANFSYVEKDRPVTMTVGYVNATKKPVSLLVEQSPASEYMTITAPVTICAGCRGEINITYDFSRSQIYGRVGNRLILTVNGRRERLGISTTAIAVDKYFAEFDPNAPSLKIDPAHVQMDNVTAGEPVESEVALSNVGKHTLIIRALESRKNAQVAVVAGTEIAPGQSIKVKVTAVPTGGAGSQYIDGVHITTNDPVFPMRELRVTATIK